MNLSWLDLVIAALATWRITHILLFEDGPFRVFRLLREYLGVKYVDDSDNVAVSFKYEITVCMWCASVWVSAIVAAVLALVPWTIWVLLPFAISGAVVSWHKKFGAD